MHKKITKTLLLITLLVLLIGITSAATVSDNTTTTKVAKDTNTAPHTEVQKSNEKVVEKKTIQKENKTEKQTKTAAKTYNVNDFDTLNHALTNDSFSEVTVNIMSDIVLKGNNLVNTRIHKLTINGNGKTIYGADAYSFLIVSNDLVTINNIKLTRNFGAIRAEHERSNPGNIIITNSILNNNIDHYDIYLVEGSAICLDYCNLTLANCTFNENYGQENWAVIGGGFTTYNMTMTNCTFNNNLVSPIVSLVGNFTIDNCTFNNNNGPIGGDNINLSNSTFNNNNGSVVCDGNSIITNCTLTNNTNWGGAVIFTPRTYYDSCTLIITNSSITHNTATSDGGGAIYSERGNITITNSNINNNTAYNDGGAIYSKIGNITITNSNLTHNTATKGYGGAIYSEEGNITVINSNITHNNATGTDYFSGGGAIKNAGNINIINSNLTHNTATEEGGAIYNWYGTINITNSKLTHNTAAKGYGGAIKNAGNINITNSNLTHNTAAEDGGAIYNYLYEMCYNLTITNSNITYNNATEDYSRAISNAGNINITDSDISHNNRGAIYNCNGDINIMNSNLTDNREETIYNSEGNINITDSNLTHNNGRAINNRGNINIINSNLTQNKGGAIYNYRGKTNITDSNLNYNTAEQSGGAIYNKDCALNITNSNLNYNTANNWGGAIYTDNSTTTIINSNFTHNKVTNGNGGAISGRDINITNCDLSYNTATNGSGGAISGGDINITNCDLSYNTATEEGGAISGRDINITNCDLSYNTATENGGAIYNEFGTSTITNTNLTHNTARYNGGAINNWDDLIIINSNLTHNNATENGGAIYNYEGKINITDSNLNYNTAGFGGAINNYCPYEDYYGYYNLTITDSNLNNNTAEQSGGAIYSNNYYVNIADSNMTHNTATNGNGGAVYHYAFDEDFTYSKLIVTDSNLNYNTAEQSGGAIYSNNYYVNIADSNMTRNTATNGSGGAVYSYGGYHYYSTYSNLTISNSNITDNTAELLGGAVCKLRVDLNVTNSTIKNNSAKQSGGAIYAHEGMLVIINNKISNNSANEGAAIRNTNSTHNYPVEIINNTFKTNKANMTSKAIIVEGEATVYNNTNADVSKYYGTIYTTNSADVLIKDNIFDDGIIYTRIEISTNESNPRLFDTIDVSVLLKDYSNNTLSNQKINLKIGDKIYNLTTNSYGKATQIFTITSNQTLVTARFAGNEKYAESTNTTTILINKMDTKLTLTVSNSSPLNNTPITITATLTDINNNKLPNQNITLNIAGKTVTIKTNTNGVATYNYTPTKVETQTITAKYNGNGQYYNSSATTSINVKKINTLLSIKASNNTPQVNNIITITATLTDTNNNKLPDQNIILTVNNNNYTLKTDKNGQISQTYKTTSTGKQTITAKYNGNTQYNSNSATTSITVQKINTILSIKASNNSPIYGTSVTITAALTDAYNNKLSNQNINLNIAGKAVTVKTNTNGVVTYSYTPTKVETQTITAKYDGNTWYNSNSATTSITVQKINSTLSIKVSNSTPLVNNIITITATLTDTNNNKLTDQNIILTVNNNNYTLKTDKNGQIIQTYKARGRGDQTITAKYNGNSTINPSITSTKITVRDKINTETVTTSLTGVIGENLTLEAKVTDVNKNKVNEGVVIFKINNEIVKDNGKLNGSSTPLQVKVTNGVARTTIIPDNSMIKAINLTADYLGSDTYNPSMSNVAQLTIQKGNITITLKPVKGVIGETITLHATLTDMAGRPISGGNLAFKLNGKTLRSDGRFDSKAPAMKFKVQNGIVSYTIKADMYLRSAKILTASYSGTNTYAESTSNTVTAQIQKRYAVVTVTSSPSYAKQYETLTFTVKAKDTTKNSKNNTSIYTNTKVMIKVNGVSIKDAKGKVLYLTLDKNAQATYKYTIPGGTGGITKNKTARNYTVTAIFSGEDYYPGVKDTTHFQVARSATYVNITQAKVTKTNVLSIKATLKDFKGNYLMGTNKVTIKINGKSYLDPKNGKAKYWSVKNGVVDLTGIQVDPKTKIKRIMLVTGERQAYLEGRTETTKIIRA